MSETIRVSGKTLEDAITNATIRLGVTSDNIVYTIIEHESKGFLGIGAKDAVIEVRAKDEADFEAERLKIKAEEDAARAAQEAARKAEEEKEAALRKEMKEEQPVPETSEQEEDPAVEETVEETVPETEETSEETYEAAPGKREREIKPLEDPSEAIARAEGFLRDVYQAMDMDVDLVSSYDGEVLNVQMNGDDMGILIGKRGQTLDSLQYLVSLVVNKGSSTYVRVKLDTENYRERRKATLENLAKNIAVKVKKSRQSVYLEPMNPYERRIIHSALQNEKFITTYSEGEEPYRKVIVALKKDENGDVLLQEERFEKGGRGRNGRGRNGRGGRKGRDYKGSRDNRRKSDQPEEGGQAADAAENTEE